MDRIGKILKIRPVISRARCKMRNKLMHIAFTAIYLETCLADNVFLPFSNQLPDVRPPFLGFSVLLPSLKQHMVGIWHNLFREKLSLPVRTGAEEKDVKGKSGAENQRLEHQNFAAWRSESIAAKKDNHK